MKRNHFYIPLNSFITRRLDGAQVPILLRRGPKRRCRPTLLPMAATSRTSRSGSIIPSSLLPAALTTCPLKKVRPHFAGFYGCIQQPPKTHGDGQGEDCFMISQRHTIWQESCAGQEGPLTVDEIKQAFFKGKLFMDTLIWTAGMARPLQLGAIRQMRWMLASPAGDHLPCALFGGFVNPACMC